MDRETWKIVTDSVRRATRQVGTVGRRPVYTDRLIVLMYIWSVWHGRCLSWACDRLHYNTLFRPRKLPSISQFTRRIKTDVCQAILQRMQDDLAGRGVRLPLQYIDGMPQTVSPVSKDPDAARGHVTGGYAKGYKLHAIVNENRRIVVWSVMPLNVDEKTVARVLAAEVHTPPSPVEELTLADSNYDAAPLYKAFAAAGHTLLTDIRGSQFVGPQGRPEKKLRAMGPQRRAALGVWEHHEPLADYVMEQRNNIEGVFSVLSVTGGLGSLPSFVRRLGRVRRWVGTKIILYHARLWAQETAAESLVA